MSKAKWIWAARDETPVRDAVARIPRPRRARHYSKNVAILVGQKKAVMITVFLRTPSSDRPEQGDAAGPRSDAARLSAERQILPIATVVRRQMI
jgi:hypothetical protein